ncbi:MAG: oligopeptide transporter, OPT family, partial [Burkholderiaceae bacterium]|nr:oligopeptide transporter, OPT family [Burkholderiaceae bacterium]
MENHSNGPLTGLRELTLRGIILGALITIVFTASNVYLGLKVGLTFSSSIPAAVISMAVLKLFSKSDILENNMVQTQASAAGTLSSIIFVLPGLVMIGYWQGFPYWETLGICAAGGMLGVVFTIPLRHAMVVKSDLPYPEGVAAAEILRVGCATSASDSVSSPSNAPAEKGMRDIASGGLMSAAFALLSGGFRVLSDSAAYWFSIGRAAVQLPIGFSMALLGAGYLIGLASGIAMLMGLVIAWGIAVPWLTAITTPTAGQTLADSGSHAWATQVRFMGAGLIAIAAIWTLITLFKPMMEGVKMSFSSLRGGSQARQTRRVEQDLSPRWIMIITLLIVVVLAITFGAFLGSGPLSTGLFWQLLICAVLFAVIFGFLIAAACGYMAGLIGSSASPISGIGIIGVTLVSLLLLLINSGNGVLAQETGVKFTIGLAIFITSAVVAVATISNDNLQDLKTGWLVGATPWRQQVALLIGCVVGAAVIPPVLVLLYHAYGFSGAMPRADMDPAQVLAAPQATLMATIATGIFTHKLDWTMLLIGVVLGIVMIIIDALLKMRGGNARLPPLAGRRCTARRLTGTGGRGVRAVLRR